VTHQEKDFGDHLEESITKLEGAILRQRCLLTELIHSQKNIGTAHFITQANLIEAHIAGLQEAKTILLGG